MSAGVSLTDDLLRRTLQARGATQVSERGLADEIAVEIGRMPQVRAWPGLRSRWLSKAVAAATLATLATVAAVGIALVGMVSRPSIKVIDVGAGGSLTPALEAGRYTSATFAPAIAFTLPAGRWAPAVDLPTELRLRSVEPDQSDDRGSITVIRLANVATGGICGYDGSTPWPPGSSDAQSFVTWLHGRLTDGLGAPRPVRVAGRDGLELDFQATTALRQECDYGLLLTDVGTAASPRFAEIPVDGRRVRLAAVDVSGTLVVVLTEGGWTNRFDDVVHDADAIIASMAFD